jgi:hypothetical protein
MGLSDSEQINNLIGRYAHCIDEGRHGDLVALAVDDAVYDLNGEIVNGTAGFAATVAAKEIPGRVGKHLTSNVVIDVDGDTATATIDYTYIGRDSDGPLTVFVVGRYADRFVRRDGRWLISHCVIRRV